MKNPPTGLSLSAGSVAENWFAWNYAPRQTPDIAVRFARFRVVVEVHVAIIPRSIARQRSSASSHGEKGVAKRLRNARIPCAGERDGRPFRAAG